MPQVCTSSLKKWLQLVLLDSAAANAELSAVQLHYFALVRLPYTSRGSKKGVEEHGRRGKGPTAPRKTKPNELSKRGIDKSETGLHIFKFN